jgi:hypothetical protein
VLVGLYETDDKPTTASESGARRGCCRRCAVLLLCLLILFFLVAPRRAQQQQQQQQQHSFLKEYLGGAVGSDSDKLKQTVETQTKQLSDKDDEIAQLKAQVRTHMQDARLLFCAQRCSHPRTTHLLSFWVAVVIVLLRLSTARCAQRQRIIKSSCLLISSI